MTRQERAYRLIFQDGTLSGPMTRSDAEAVFILGHVAEIVHVVRRKSGAFRKEAKQ